MIDLKTTFNTSVESYHSSRPHYPEQLFEKLIMASSLSKKSELLEIGPGTGQATLPLAKQGFSITAVEFGEQMAAKARQVLAAFKNVRVITGAFEDIDLPQNYFDLIYSATAFHWIKPEVQFAKTHKLLKPGGFLAIIQTRHVADGGDGDEFFLASQPIYQKYHSGTSYDGYKPERKDPEKLEDLRPHELDESLFSFEDFGVFPLKISYSSAQFTKLLSTYSPHLALPENKRKAFLSEIKQLIDQKFDGQRTKLYGFTLTLAKKRL